MGELEKGRSLGAICEYGRAGAGSRSENGYGRSIEIVVAGYKVLHVQWKVLSLLISPQLIRNRSPDDVAHHGPRDFQKLHNDSASRLRYKIGLVKICECM